MGSEDFSYVLQRVPGAMLDLGVAPPDDPNPPANHSNRMMVEEPAMANGIALYVGLALSLVATAVYLRDGARASRAA